MGITGSFYNPNQGYGGGGSSGGQYDDLMKLLGMGTKTVSPWLSLLTQFGGGILGGLGSLFGGESEEEKAARERRGLIKTELGRPSPYNMQGFLANVSGAIAPEANKLAGNMSARLGLDSGAAQGEIMKFLMGKKYEAAANYQQNFEQAEQERRLRLILGM